MVIAFQIHRTAVVARRSTYMEMDERLPPAIEGIRELPIVGDVPDVYFVRRIVRCAWRSNT